MSDETASETTDETTDKATDEATDETTSDTAVETTVESVVDVPAESTAVAQADTKADDTDDGRTNSRKVREGIVVSDKMDSTLVVAVNERVRHARYGKTVQRTKKLYVHDEKNEAKVGDKVRVQETRPLSKLKRWRLTEIVERAR